MELAARGKFLPPSRIYNLLKTVFKFFIRSGYAKGWLQNQSSLLDGNEDMKQGIHFE